MTDNTCMVCCGTGTYPIIDRRGSTLYEIHCPECGGEGVADVAAPDAKPVSEAS